MADTILDLPVLHGSAPLSGLTAKLVLFQNRLVANFDESGQAIVYQAVLSDKYLGGNINVKLFWVMDPFTLGDAGFSVSWRRLSAGIDYSSDIYDVTNSVVAVSGGLDILNVDNVLFTNAQLGYNVNTIDPLFQLLIRATTVPLMGTTGISNLKLLNIVLENV